MEVCRRLGRQCRWRLLGGSGQKSWEDSPNSKRRSILIGRGPRQEEHDNGQSYKGNKIHTTKYTLLSFIPMNLFQQFQRVANLYFLFLILLNWVPVVEAFQKEITMIPLLLVLTVIALKDGVEDYRRYIFDKKINNRVATVYCRQQKDYVGVRWKDVQVGDFVRLSCNHITPADILLLYSSDPGGTCFIETANLDGETNLKEKRIVSGIPLQAADFNPENFHSRIECDDPNDDLATYRGFMEFSSGSHVGLDNNNLLLRGCTIRNTETVVGVVVYAGKKKKKSSQKLLFFLVYHLHFTHFFDSGHETKAMMNNSGPKYKRSHLEKRLNVDILWCVLLLVIMCLTTSIGHGLWLKRIKNAIFLPNEEIPPALAGFYIFWTMIIILQVLIPISLYVSIEIVKVGQVYFIQKDLDLYDEHANRGIQCRALNITENLGHIRHLFSDKTGTLTENDMVFRRCSIYGIEYPHLENGRRLELYETEKNDASGRRETLQRQSVNYDCNGSSVSVHAFLDESDEDERASNHFLPRSSGLAKKVIPDPELVKKISCLQSPTMPSEATSSLEVAAIIDFFLAMAVCNSVLVSSPMMPQHVTEKEPENKEELTYEAASPDEAALVHAAQAYRCTLLERSPQRLQVDLPGMGTTDIRLLHVLPFDCQRKRMSVVIRHPLTEQAVVYTKGADSVVMDLAGKPAGGEQSEESYRGMKAQTQEHLDQYAREGLRTLCFAKKVLGQEEYQVWLEKHLLVEKSIENRQELMLESIQRLESNLTLLGCTGIVDRLQEDVPSTVEALQKAGIKIWVLTGDKQETAVNVAYACRLVGPEDQILRLNCENQDDCGTLLEDLKLQARTVEISGDGEDGFVLVVDGRTLDWALGDHSSCFLELSRRCKAVLCCRCTPSQKSRVAQLVRNRLKVSTLAVGDGANDVSMIRVADVGIGISGQEGMQAVMASDFAISRFKHLRKLLLVHGRWSLSRLGNMMLYFIYKNVMFVNLLFWYQFFCGFSGAVMTNAWVLIFFNLFFTSVPPLVYGVLDKDVPAERLTAEPELYRAGRASEACARFSFWLTVLDAFYQSLVCFFVPYLTYVGSDVGLLSFGSPINASALLIVLLHQVIESHNLTWIHVLVLVLSGGSYFGFVLVFAISCRTCGPLGVETWQMSQPLFYFVCTLTVVTALTPRLLFRVLGNTFRLKSNEHWRRIQGEGNFNYSLDDTIEEYCRPKKSSIQVVSTPEL
ncbi:phospholipid-transporting ATPase VD isoform X2 [Stigmatopora argus]